MNKIRQRVPCLVRKIIDVILSVICLICTTPIMLVIAFLIKREDFGKKAREKVDNELNWVTLAEQLKKIHKNILVRG